MYTEEALQLRSKRPRHRKMVVRRRERYESKRPNQASSMDFIADQLVNGTGFRAMPIADMFTCAALDIVVAQRLPSEHAIEACNRLLASRGVPARIFGDNGSEFLGRVFDLWAYHCGAVIDFNRPGKSPDNCFIETFNRSFRDEVLDCYVFETLDEVRRMTADWIVRYNEYRPYESLGNLSPRQYLMARCA